MFDFDKYYKNLSATTDAKIEIKDLPIKSDSSAAAEDENGDTYDTTLNEIVTKNIDYIVTNIDVSPLGANYNTSLYNGSKADKKNKIIQSTVLFADKDESEPNEYSFRQYSPLDDAEYTVMKQDGSEIGTFVTRVPLTVNNTTSYTNVNVTVVPKHTLIKESQPYVTNDNVYAHTLAMFGLYGGGSENLYWANSDRWENRNCVMSSRTLSKRVKRISNKCADAQFEVETTTYYDLNDPKAEGSASRVDVTVPDKNTVAKHMTATAVQKYGNTKSFSDKMTKYGYMIDGNGDKKTPFIPSLRDAFIAYYEPKEDLADEFNDEFDSVIRAIKKLWRFKKKLPKKTRQLIEKVTNTKPEYITPEQASYTNMTGLQWLVDIETMLAIKAPTNEALLPMLITPFWTSENLKMARLYPAFTRLDTVTLTNQRTFGGHCITESYYYGPEYSKIGNNTTTTYQFNASDFDSVAELVNAKFSYTEYSLEEFADLIRDYYETYIKNSLTTPFSDAVVENLINVCTNIAIHSATMPLNVQAVFGPMPQILPCSGTSTEREALYTNPEYENMKIRVINWRKGAEVDDDKGTCKGSDYKHFIPDFLTDDNNSSAFIHDKLAIVDKIDDIVERFNVEIAILAVTISAPMALVLKLLLRRLEEAVRDFKRVTNKIMYFEYYTAESVFDTKERILSDRQCWNVDRNGCPLTATLPARFLVPTKIYKKVKKRIKIFRWYRTYTKKVYVGVRWTEVRFVNVSLFDRYPKDNYVPKNKINFVSAFSIKGTTMTTENEIPNEINNGDSIGVKIKGLAPEYDCEVTDRHTLELNGDEKPNIKSGTTEYLVTSLANSKPGDATSAVTINYKFPYFPYDDEMRGYAYGTYGPLDQSQYAIKSRGETKYGKDGWEIFHDTSTEISALRKGINIYPSVAHLVRILKENFGKNRVQLCDTMRSLEDQNNHCLGGAESSFLSWHNYGLAVTILIYQEDGKTNIEDGSDDMKKLIDIAEKFTNDCLAGKYGAKFNVVWCGRLKVGANLFDWEFLPLGVNHKDAPKFRDSIIAQRDPVVDFSYVPADKYARTPAVAKEYNDKRLPWISNTSKTYQQAELINGVKYISPKTIRNFPFPKDLPLINVIEFLRLIQLKMSAYGTKMPNNCDMYDWINKNDISYNQLLIYFGMIGNLQSFKALLAGEYIARYKPVVNTYYLTNSIEFVKNYLGDFYYQAQIKLKDSNDAFYISLHDGKLHLPCMDGRPWLKLSSDNLFDQKRITKNDFQRGRWVDGIFIPSTSMDEIVSPGSVIGGYTDGEAVGGDAYLLHAYVADQIKTEYDKIVEMFENYNGDLLFDSYGNGPYADKYELLENEFGIIAAQDLISFDDLRNIMAAIDVNNGNNSILHDGTSLGLNDRTVYEKVVSNAEVSGMRIATLTDEHVEINPLKDNSLTIEQFYEIINNGNSPTANDIMK